MNALFAAFLETVCTYGLTALGAAIVLVWEPTPKQMQTVMALAVGLMLSAVLDLFASAEEEAKEVYGSVAYVVPLVVGVAVATGTLVFLEKFCFAAAPEADETEHSAVGGPDSDEDMKGVGGPGCVLSRFAGHGWNTTDRPIRPDRHTQGQRSR